MPEHQPAMIARWICPLLLSALPGPGADPPPGREVAEATIASLGRIERLLVDYYLASADGKLRPRTDRFVEAFGGDRYFSDNIHFTSREQEPWYDPNRRLMWTSPGLVTIYSPFNREARSHKPDPGASVPLSPYLTCIGWGPGRGKLETPSGADPFFLDDVLAADRADRVAVLSERARVNDLSCLVLVVDGGRDRIWVCPDRGYTVVKRAIRDRDGDGADFQCINGDFVEAAPGLWLPRRCNGLYTQKGEAARRRSFRIEATHLAVNEGVSDDQFRPSFAPGTHAFDEDGSLVAAIPGGMDLLDHWAAYGSTFFPPTDASMVFHAEDYTLMCIGVTLIAWGLWLAVPPGRVREASPVHAAPQPTGA
jgi:hypothetical protein